MALVSSVDYPNKKIYLGIDSVGVDLDTIDIYKEVRALRRTTEAHRKFDPMIVAGGNIQKTATTYTAPYVQLLNGCEIIPYDAAQTLTLTRDTFSDDGRAGGQCFDTTGFTNVVNIIESVDKVEVREVTGAAAAQDIRDAMALGTTESAASGSIDEKLNKIKPNTDLIPGAL